MSEVAEHGGSEKQANELLSPDAVNYLFERCVVQQIPTLEQGGKFQAMSEDLKAFFASTMTLFAVEEAANP
jgi:hypothetical protein